MGHDPQPSRFVRCHPRRGVGGATAIAAGAALISLRPRFPFICRSRRCRSPADVRVLLVAPRWDAAGGSRPLSVRADRDRRAPVYRTVPPAGGDHGASGGYLLSYPSLGADGGFLADGNGTGASPRRSGMLTGNVLIYLFGCPGSRSCCTRAGDARVRSLPFVPAILQVYLAGALPGAWRSWGCTPTALPWPSTELVDARSSEGPRWSCRVDVVAEAARRDHAAPKS